MKTLEPKTKLPFGHPNGHVLWNWWGEGEQQEQNNVKYAFLAFDREERIGDVRQQILQAFAAYSGEFTSIETINPIGEIPKKIFKSRDIFYDFFYLVSNKGYTNNTWMHQCVPIFIKDRGLLEFMNDVAVEGHARYISRRR